MPCRPASPRPRATSIPGVARTLAVLAASLVVFAAAFAQPGTPSSTEDTRVTDPDSGFAVTVPAGWARSSADGVLTLTDPDGSVTAWVLALDGGDALEAIAAAWQRVDPGFALEPAQTTVPPASPPWDEIAQIVYATPRDTVVAGLGYRTGDRVFVFLARGPLDAYVKRQAQISVIATSIASLSAHEDDLAGTAPAPVEGALADDLDAYVPDALGAADVPGAVVAVVQDGRLAYLRAFGVRSTETGAAMTTDAPMMIGSVTKSFTTLMMASLVEDGTMRWDTPVVDVLPSFALADPEATRTLTVRNLVCACTGVPRRDLEFLLNADTLGAEGVVASLASFQLYTKVGETFQYSNQMVAAGGYIAAVAAGADPHAMLPGYAAELQRRVLTPLGLRDTTLSFLQIAADDRHATPHGLTLDRRTVPIPLAEEHALQPVAPAATLWSTAPDLARYLATLLAGGVTPDGRRVIGADALATLFEPQTHITASIDYALGWMVTDWKGLRLIQHDGNTFGFTASVAMLPEKGLGVVVLSNARVANAFTTAVVQRVLDGAFGVDPGPDDASFRFALDYARNSASGALDRLQDDLAPAVLAPRLGRYANPALGSVTLSLEGDTLWLDVGEFRQRLRRILSSDGESLYIAMDPPLAGLVLSPEVDGGVPSWRLVWPPEDYRFTRVPASPLGGDARGGSPGAARAHAR